MPITINGSGTITGISAGGLPDATITQAELATGVAGTGPAFSAYVPAGGQSIANATSVVLQFPNEDFDTAGCYNNTGSTATLNGLSVPAYSFCPNVAGYYQVNAAIRIPGSPSSESLLTIRKNGSEFMRGLDFVGITTFAQTPLTAYALVYLNGTGDYIDVSIYQGSGSTQTLAAGSVFKFQAYLARAA